MTRSEAVQIISNVLDATVQKGFYVSLADAVKVEEAFALIADPGNGPAGIKK